MELGRGKRSTEDDSPAPAERHSVVLVDDDPIVRQWLVGCLAPSEFHVVGKASTGAEGLHLVARRAPELLLLDFRLPDMPGTLVLRRLRERPCRPRVMVITANPVRGLNEVARELGADGTMLKSTDKGALLAALRAVVRGERTFDPCHPRRDSRVGSLTPREREVLHLIAGGSTNSEVATALGVGDETVKTLVSRSFLKLGVRRRAEAVAAAQGLGIL